MGYNVSWIFKQRLFIIQGIHTKQTLLFHFLLKKNLKKLIHNEEKYKDMQANVYVLLLLKKKRNRIDIENWCMWQLHCLIIRASKQLIYN